jgi:transcriptional regulator with XRE-family HTH domain
MLQDEQKTGVYPCLPLLLTKGACAMTSTDTLAPTVASAASDDAEERHPFLVALGERVRNLRSRKGMTRKAVAIAADVSERHLANLEYGTGNASILVLLQVAQALHCSLAELIGDVTTSSPEWLLIRELLQGRNEADLRRARLQLVDLLGASGGVDAQGRQARVALIGLRGAGKSTLGQRLADDLGFPSSSSAARSSSSPVAASAKSTTSMAPTPTAATSVGPWKRRSRSTPRW